MEKFDNDLEFFGSARSPVPSMEQLHFTDSFRKFSSPLQDSLQSQTKQVKHSGQMYKYKNFIERFSKRYFVLEGHYLVYSKKKELTELQESPMQKVLQLQNEQLMSKAQRKMTKQETKFLKDMNRIDLRGCQVFRDKHDNKRFFLVTREKKSIRFKTETFPEREAWVRNIEEAIDSSATASEDQPGSRGKLFDRIEFEKGSPVTLEEISRILTEKASELNLKFEMCQLAVEKVVEALEGISSLTDGKKVKEAAKQACSLSRSCKCEFEGIFEYLRETQRRLFEIAEDMAYKSMQNKDRNTIIRESFMQQKGDFNQLLLDLKDVQPIEEEKNGGGLAGQNGDEDNFEEIFYDAVDFVPSKSMKLAVESFEREELPVLKDPKQKISIWAILKDSIGKDFTKISMPVYFCDPLSITQKTCQQVEYADLLDRAMQEEDSIKRLAFVTAFSISSITNVERTTTKPFNSLLGETFELMTEKYQFLSEQVSHHPPITAFYLRGYAGYEFWSNSSARSNFTMKRLEFVNPYRNYIRLKGKGPNGSDELFEFVMPNISCHNLIIGTPYVDFGGLEVVRNLSRPEEVAEINFYRRGWGKKDAFRFAGEVKRGGQGVAKVQGNWNSQLCFIDSQENKEVLWEKAPYPANWEWMYGYSHFTIQLNNLPKALEGLLPPTDTRRRPDQRALENGDMKLAASEKLRLEERQRRVRRSREKQGLGQAPPLYFDLKMNDRDGLEYYEYNGSYFEKDRRYLDWTRSPDIFGREEEEKETE